MNPMPSPSIATIDNPDAYCMLRTGFDLIYSMSGLFPMVYFMSSFSGFCVYVLRESFYLFIYLIQSQGKVEVTISRGRVVWENGQLNVAPGSGKYIEMPPFGYLFDGIDKADSNYLSSLRAPVKRSKATSWVPGSVSFTRCITFFLGLTLMGKTWKPSTDLKFM